MSMLHPVTQGSEAWHKLRLGRPTASGLSNLLTPEWKRRTGEMPRTYLFSKIAEVITGKSEDEDAGSWAMEQGTLLESEAIPFYEFLTDTKVQRMGFVTDDHMQYGCSPDGLIGEDCGIEVKCPRPHTHVKYLLDGGLPKEYACQVHGSMYVTERPSWVFLSYCRGFPPHIVTVLRDDKIQAAIKEALDYFLEDFKIALDKIKRLQDEKPARAAAA